MKCLITGAGGFVGRALCTQLTQAGAQVIALYHQTPPPPNLSAVCVDLRLPFDSAELFEGVDTVYHCAGIAHQTAAEADYQRVNFAATMELAQAAERSGVQRFIFLSSVKASAQGNGYGYWKHRAEEGLLEMSSATAMGVLVLRPALVYGAGVKGNLALLARLVQMGMPAPPEGEPRSLIALDDLCQCLQRLGQLSVSGGARYTLTDGEGYTLGRLYRAYRQAAGQSPGSRWTPAWLWQLFCWTHDLLRRQPGVEALYDKLFKGVVDTTDEELLTRLQWQPQFTFEDQVSVMSVGAG